MYEIVNEVARYLTEPSPLPSPTPGGGAGGQGGSGGSEVLVAIVGVVGTIVVAAITAFVGSFKRPRTPNSTVDSIENLNAMRHDDSYKAQIQDLREDLDVANYEKDSAAHLYSKLREAVWSKGLNPDKIMQELGT